MHTAYDPDPWSELALGMAGAAAALAGLLFVAVSINLDAVVAEFHAPHYAAEALIMLVTPVFVGLAVLIPDQPGTALGVELLALAVALGLSLAWLNRPAARSREQPVWAWLLGNVLVSVIVVGGLALAGAGTLARSLGGLYWLPAVIAASLLGGLANAWTLLIEIRRPD